MSRVLIADDSPFMRRILREILAEGGYQIVSECQNGLEASEQYKSTRPDLVLLDYNMPKMNGIDGARNILKYDPRATIIMVTAVVGKKKMLEVLRIGVKNYITKPFENNSLLSTLRRVMGDNAPIPAKTIPDADGSFVVVGSFFGQYLLQKGILNKEQLLRLLEIQAEVNRKIGQLAIDEGMLLPEHVETILKVQKRINKYFGQLAIQMGLLTEEKVTYLLKVQQENYTELDEIIVRENMLPKDALKKELEQFKMLDEGEQGVFNMRWVSKNFQNGFIYETFIEQTLKLVMRLAGIFVMEGECTFERKQFKGNGVLIRISVSGDIYWSYCLNVSANLATQIATAMLESAEAGQDGNNLNMEAANEFANIVCGNAVGKLDGKNIKLELSPPSTKLLANNDVISFREEEQVLCVPILVPEGEMELIISGVDIFRPVEQ